MSKSKARHGYERLEPFQRMYLEYTGEKLPKCKSMGEMIVRMPFERLCDGLSPVFTDERKAMPPWELWRRHGNPKVLPYGWQHWPKSERPKL